MIPIATIPSAINHRTTGEMAIETFRLTKSFGERTVVDDLSIHIPDSSIAAFVGPNGSGKTTTIRMLLGLVYPTSGTARVLGCSIRRPQEYLPGVGALIEGPAFYPALSGRANLEALRILGGFRRKEVNEVLDLVGLSKRADDRTYSYSLGMKQRLGLAAALLPRPKLLVLDEPGNGLDPTGMAAMRTLLRNVADHGTTIFVSSHQLSEVQQVADWVIIINEGKLRYQGTLSDLLIKTSAIVVTPERPGDLPRLSDALTKRGYLVAVAGSGEVMVKVGKEFAPELNRLAMQIGITLSEVRSTHWSLEDVYFAMTDGQSRP